MDYIFVGIGLLLFAIYYYYTSTFNHWKNHGIPGPQPAIFVGNFLEILIRKVSLSDKVKELYDKYKTEPMFGIFEGRTPILVVNDLDLIKDILIRDFPDFVDRGFPIYPKAEKLGEHLFALEPERWKPMRTKLSPIFTSGKLKEMFPLVLECAKNLEKCLDKVVNTNEPVDCRDLAAKFTTDVIGSCAFGLSMNALSDEESEFRRMGKKLFAPSLKLSIRELVKQFTPYLYSQFGSLLQWKDCDEFLIKAVMDTIKYREEKNIVRSDFINTLIELKNNPDKLENIELTNALLAAQAFVFFAAGFETSSTTIANALYSLAQHQNMQDKLREEIREAYRKNNGVLSFQLIKEMKYLDKVFKETLRLYPILAILTRQAMRNYTFKGTTVTIEKDTKVWIPVYGIQKDPNIYQEPDKFDPERFNDVAFTARHPMTYLPFGNGPRNCIGTRFAYYQTKVGIITILRNHKVEVCEKTHIPYESEPRSFTLSLKGAAVYLKLTKV